MDWFVKCKRAQTETDDETWQRGGVSPTLNGFDCGESRATVVVVPTPVYSLKPGQSEAAGGPFITEGVVPTLQAQNNGSTAVPAVNYSVVAPTLSATNNPSRSPQSAEVTAQVEAMVNATSVVRRLTPIECERLQGFPDNWTAGQADTHRYKQMGNAVTVNVAHYIGVMLTHV